MVFIATLGELALTVSARGAAKMLHAYCIVAGTVFMIMPIDHQERGQRCYINDVLLSID